MLRVIEAALAANDTDVPRRLDIRCNKADSKVGVFVFRNGQLLGDVVAYDLDAQTVTRCIGGASAEPTYVTEQHGVHVSWQRDYPAHGDPERLARVRATKMGNSFGPGWIPRIID